MSEQVSQQVNITYETLFDILRVEKGREDVQQISETFYRDVVVYLKQKKDVLKKKEHESGIDSFDEVKKLRIQYENIQRLVKEICQRREKKILLMALNSSRTKHNVGRDATLLQEEKMLFERLKFVLDENRKNIINTLINAQMPGSIPGEAPLVRNTMRVEEEAEQAHQEQAQKGEQESQQEAQETSLEASANIVAQAVEQQEDTQAMPDGMRLVKFLEAVEQFIGPELETYGPYEPQTTAHIPENIAQILIDNGKAQAN